ncbi:hypothetical protein B296_00018397, partial [Ensete ventricosum]
DGKERPSEFSPNLSVQGIDQDLLDLSSHDPSAPYCIPPNITSSRRLPTVLCPTERGPAPAAVHSTEHFFVSRHIQLPCPSCLLHPTSIVASSSSSSCSSLLRVPPHPTPLSVVPSPSNEHCSLVFLVVVLLLHSVS